MRLSRNGSGSGKGRTLAAVGFGVLILALILEIGHLAGYKGNYVMISVEESSSLALRTWPVLSEDPVQAWPDVETRTLELAGRSIPRTAVMAVHYSANSLGVRFSDRVLFSATGRLRLPLLRPLSWRVPGENGELVEAVDNSARVLLGDLCFDSCDPRGSVTLRYGTHRVQLGPGESWGVLLVARDEGIQEIAAERWREEVEQAIALGYPVTRLMVTNMGLWPRDRVVRVGEGDHGR